MIPGLNSLAAKIAAGAALGALILAGVVWALYRAETRSHDRTRDALAVEQARHAVTIASLDALASEMEKMVQDGELRRERLSSALAEARNAADDLREQANEVRQTPVRDCVTPNVIRRSGL
jgi:hypothetical protein